MKKSKLIIEYEFDFDAYGIATSVKGYKLAWEINQRLGVHLVKQPDLPVGFKNGEEKCFAYYSYETRLNRLKLLKNKPQDGAPGKYFLVPEFPHFDFIIFVRLNEHTMSESVAGILKEIPSVALVTVIPLDGLKSKSNFVF